MGRNRGFQGLKQAQMWIERNIIHLALSATAILIFPGAAAAAAAWILNEKVISWVILLCLCVGTEMGFGYIIIMMVMTPLLQYTWDRLR